MEKPVVFKNEKNQQLVGMLHLPEKKGKFPGVIFLPGFAGTKSQGKFLEIARKLAKNRIASLRFDYSGSGDSEGEFWKLTIKQELNDLRAALNFFLKQRFIKEKIGLVAHSLGCVIAVLSALENRKIKTLVLLAPALNQKKLIREWHSNYKIRKWKKIGYLDEDDFRIGYQYFKEVKDKNYEEEAQKLKIPILIIQGKKDKVVKLSYSKRLFKLLKGPKELRIIKEGDHDLERFGVRKEISRIVLKWFKKYLR